MKNAVANQITNLQAQAKALLIELETMTCDYERDVILNTWDEIMEMISNLRTFGQTTIPQPQEQDADAAHFAYLNGQY